MQSNKKYLSLKELHFTYEKNFLLFSKLLPNLCETYNFLYGLPKDEFKLHEIKITSKKISKFTTDINIYFKDSSLEGNVEIEVRLYQEAKMAEVMKFQGFHNSLISILPVYKRFGFTKDERFQWNSFLSHFLTHSINSGRSLENHLPARI